MSIETTVQDLLEERLHELGYEIVRVKFFDRIGTLQIMIDTLDVNTAVTVNDCAKVSHAVSAILDVEDPISGHYNLEVSSPGIDRPLVKLADFIRFKGKHIKVALHEPIDNVKKFKCILNDVVGEDVLVKLEGGKELTINFRTIFSANLES